MLELFAAAGNSVAAFEGPGQGGALRSSIDDSQVLSCD